MNRTLRPILRRLIGKRSIALVSCCGDAIDAVSVSIPAAGKGFAAKHDGVVLAVLLKRLAPHRRDIGRAEFIELIAIPEDGHAGPCFSRDILFRKKPKKQIA